MPVSLHGPCFICWLLLSCMSVSGCGAEAAGGGRAADASGHTACVDCGDASGDGAGQQCVPGQSTSCACADGARGAQMCLGDGSAYGPCICAESAGALGAADAMQMTSEGATGAMQMTSEGAAGDGGGMPQIQYPPCPGAFVCQALPAAPDTPVCLDPAAPTGIVLPPPCGELEDCSALGLDPSFTQCLETASTGNDFGKLCFTGCREAAP